MGRRHLYTRTISSLPRARGGNRLHPPERGVGIRANDSALIVGLFLASGRAMDGDGSQPCRLWARPHRQAGQGRCPVHPEEKKMGEKTTPCRKRSCWEVALARQAVARRRAKREPSFMASLEGNLLMAILVTGTLALMQNIRIGAPMRTDLSAPTATPGQSSEPQGRSEEAGDVAARDLVRSIALGAAREMRRQRQEDRERKRDHLERMSSASPLPSATPTPTLSPKPGR